MDNADLIAHLVHENIGKDKQIAGLQRRVDVMNPIVELLRHAVNAQQYGRSYPSHYDWGNWESKAREALAQLDALPEDEPAPVDTGVSKMEEATHLLLEARPFIGPANLNKRVNDFLKTQGFPGEGQCW